MADKSMANIASAMDMYSGVHGGVILDEPGAKGSNQLVTKLDTILVKVKGTTDKQKVDLAEKKLKELIDRLMVLLPEGAITREKIEEMCKSIDKVNLKSLTKYTETIVETDIEELRKDIYELISVEMAKKIEATEGKGGYGPDFTSDTVKGLKPEKEKDGTEKPMPDKTEVKQLADAVDDVPKVAPFMPKKKEDDKEANLLSLFDKTAASNGAEVFEMFDQLADLLKEEYANREEIASVISEMEKAVELEEVKEEAKVEEKEAVEASRLSVFDKKAEGETPAPDKKEVKNEPKDTDSMVKDFVKLVNDEPSDFSEYIDKHIVDYAMGLNLDEQKTEELINALSLKVDFSVLAKIK